jgi:hypothetical protein
MLLPEGGISFLSDSGWGRCDVHAIFRRRDLCDLCDLCDYIGFGITIYLSILTVCVFFKCGKERKGKSRENA